MPQDRRGIHEGKALAGGLPGGLYAVPSKILKTFWLHTDELGGAKIALEQLSYRNIGASRWGENAVFDSKSCDLLFLSMPSGARVFGAENSEGLWFGPDDIVDEVSRIVSSAKPTTILLVSRKSLFTDQFGATFARILSSLNEEGYSASWFINNLSSHQLAQDAERIVMIASKNVAESGASEIWPTVINRAALLAPDTVKSYESKGLLSRLIADRKPVLGRAAPQLSNIYGSAGYSVFGQVMATRFIVPKPQHLERSISDILGLTWDLPEPPAVQSVRFVSRCGKKGLSFKRDGLVHSFGPSISAWPLFAVNRGKLERLVAQSGDISWRGDSEDFDVFRISPCLSLRLFGEEAIPLSDAIELLPESETHRYQVASATIAPNIISSLLHSLDTQYSGVF